MTNHRPLSTPEEYRAEYEADGEELYRRAWGTADGGRLMRLTSLNDEHGSIRFRIWKTASVPPIPMGLGTTIRGKDVPAIHAALGHFLDGEPADAGPIEPVTFDDLFRREQMVD